MEPIIGLGSNPQDRWSIYGNSNVYKYNGMTSDEYVAAEILKDPNKKQKREELYNEFWAKRNEAVQQTASTLNAIKENNDNSVRRLTGMELGSILRNTDLANADAIMQVQGASSQWKKLDRLLSGITDPKGNKRELSGTLLGYDIETFGDTTGKKNPFGITEIGFVEHEIQKGQFVKENRYGLVIGLDDQEVQYVNDIVNKIRTTGWDSLENHEVITMNRMSMYGGDSTSRNFKSVFSKKSFTELGGEFYVVDKLSDASMNLDQIERGIKFLSDVYKDGATRDKVLPVALEYLYKKHSPNTSSEGAILTAANSKYDTGVIKAYSNLYGISTEIKASKGKTVDLVDILKQDTVDLVYATRTAASIRGISISELQRQFHGQPGGGASVQSLLLSTGLNETETHLSVSDIIQQNKLLIAERFMGDKSLAHDISEHFEGKVLRRHNSQETALKKYEAKNSVFLLNRGWLDKTSGKDIALIPIPDKDGNINYEATQNYTISGEYWEFDTEHSGYANDKYVLSLKSTADGTIVSKQFDSTEEMGDFLRWNADWFEKNNIINPRGKNQTVHSDEQAHIKYRDRGRREFERAIDPGSVALDNGKPSGGFVAMEEYLAWNDKYGNQFEATPEGFQKYVQTVRASGEEFDVKNANTVQAALGMQEKINEEKVLLRSIVDKISQSMPDADNMTKTLALRKAYTSSIEAMKQGKKLKSTKSKSNRIANDIFGIDVDFSVLKGDIDERRNHYVNYDTISRINTYSVDSATKDIDRVFSRLTKGQVIKVLEDFGDRGILTNDQVSNFSEMIRNTGVDAGGDVKKAKEINKVLHNESIYQVYTDIAYALHDATKVETKNNIIVQGRKERGKKAPKFTVESYSENLYSNSHLIFRHNKQDYNVNNLLYDLPEVKTSVDRAIADSIVSTPRVTYFDKNTDKLRSELQQLTQKLNYGNDITKTWIDKNDVEHSETLLENMFFASEKTETGFRKYKDYSIAQHDDIHTFIIQPSPTQSAYMLLTNDRNYGKMMNTLSEMSEEDFSSFKKLRGSEIANYAGIYELPYIQRYTIEDKVSDAMKKLIGRDTIDLTVLKQSENSEKFLINALNVYEQDGKLNAYMNNGVFDYLTSWRMGGKKGLQFIKDGDFERFTSSMKRQQNKKIQELSGSSSYRGYITESGKVVRMTNYGPGDYIYAYQARMAGGLHDILLHGLTDEAGDKRNSLDKLVDAFAEEFGEYHNPNKQGLKNFRQRVAKQSYFEEFFNKNLFLGDVNQDFVISNAYGTTFEGKNIFTLLQDIVNDDVNDIFSDNVREVLQNIIDVYNTDGINQIVSLTAGEKGIFTLGIKPGEYDVNAFLYSTMRPTYSQQNLGRSFNPEEEWNMDLEGNVLKINEMGKIIREDGSQLRILKTIAGSPEITKAEYLGKKALADYQPGHDKKVRHFMTAFKQMNDYDLQMKYKKMYENADVNAKKVGMSVQQYKQYLDYMREDMLSVNEGKWFMDPLIGEQRFIRTNDAKKVFGFHVDDIDEKETRKILESLVGKEIEQNTIIAKANNGKNIYYQGPVGRFTQQNVEELLDLGETRIIPKMADIIDAKVMFNGSEKATAHAISVGRFMEYADAHGIVHGTREETTYALSRIFNILSDEAGFIGTQELEKHTNLSGLDNLWRVITTNYVHEGKGQMLVNHLNASLPKSVGKFEFEDGVIISNMSAVENPMQYILKVWGEVKDNTFGSQELNQRIVEQIDWMQKNNIIYGSMQVQNQNEHVSKGISVDKRMEQAIRERVLSIKNGGERWDLLWADELNKYAETYNAKSSNKGNGYRNVQKVFDYYNQQMNIGKTANMQKRRNMERGLHGIIESLIYYHSPDKVDVGNKNIVKIDLQNLMAAGIIPKNGVSVESLHSSLFFEDGNPSEMLAKIAKEQGKGFGTREKPMSYSLYIDLGDFKVKTVDGKSTMNGFLIPIQTVITGADTTMFQNQQSIIASALSKIENVIKNPENNTSEEITNKLSTIIGDMYTGLFKQLAVQNKDSDLYKTLQRHFMPNSGGLLAEQEIGPLLTEMTDDDDFNKAIERRKQLESEIVYRDPSKGVDESTIRELNEQYKIIEDKLSGLAKRIRGERDEHGDWIKKPEVMNFTALKGTSLEGIEKQIFKDGTARYSFVAATSKAAFEAQGLNFGKFGLDILQDYEFHKGIHVPKMIMEGGTEKELYSSIELAKVRKDIMNRINSDSSLGIKITSEDKMVSEINDWLGQKYSIKSVNKKLEIDIETLNNDIAANGPISRLLKHFDSVGEHYMRNIGMVGELTRYPTFRSQMAARWILNDHVESKQVIMFNPITSSLTNVDFDGDLMYSIFRLDGAAPFLLTDKDLKDRNAKTIYNIAKNAYEEGLKYIPDLLADLVEDGDAVKSNHINNYMGQMAAFVEKFNPKLYKEVLRDYAKEIGVEKIEKGTAEELAARSSALMENAFANMRMNTLFDAGIQKASIAPVLRKANIGRISTPNFTARNMIIGMQSHYQHLVDSKTPGAKETLDTITDILNAVSNMKSKKGGLFDDAEQKAIDTKHVWDAMTTAQIARYSTGINLLFGKYAKSDAQSQEKAITHIVSGLYNNVFTKTQEIYDDRTEGIQAIVKEVMEHRGDMEYFVKNKTPDGHLKHGLIALMKIQEIDEKNELRNVKRLFTNALNQGRTFSSEGIYMDKAVAEILDDVVNKKYTSYDKNTFMDGIGDKMAESFSDRSLQISTEYGYLKVGGIKGKIINNQYVRDDYNDFIYTLKDSGYNKKGAYAVFDVIKYDRKTGTFKQQKEQKISATNNSDLNDTLLQMFDSKFINHNTYAIKNFKEDADKTIQILNREKQSKLLKDIVLSPDKSFAKSTTMLNTIGKMGRMEKWAVNTFGKEEFHNIRAMFGLQEAQTNDIVNKVSELGQVLKYAEQKGLTGTKQVQVNSLIESINNDIARNPERYRTKDDNGNYAFTKTFDKILEDKFISSGIFDDINQINTIRKEMVLMSGFDSDTYEKALNSMRNELHNITDEVKVLNARYESLNKDFGKTSVATAAMENKQTAISNFTQALAAENTKSVQKTHDKIYSLFKDRTQLDTFFGLDRTVASGDTLVAFGEYMGYRYDQLGDGDILRVLSSVSEYNKNASGELKHAIEKTSILLNQWYTTVGTPAQGSALPRKNIQSDLLKEALKEVDNIQNSAKIELDIITAEQKAKEAVEEGIEEGVKESSERAAKETSEKMKMKTVLGELYGKTKDLISSSGITGKHVGFVVAGMAALGIANNLIHNQKNDSPLTPTRKPGRESPSIMGNKPEHSSPSGYSDAPRSVGNKVIYHDKQSGFNFKVSAKTARDFDARQQGVNIASMTGGQTNINIQQDNSGITDNWLANKFAELS